MNTFILLSLFASKTQGLLIKYAKNQTNITINKVIDSTIRKILIEEEYTNIIEIEKNEDYEITNVNFNNNKINYKVPYGLMSDNHFLHNLGPSIPYQISILGQINNNTYINIKEYGINNSIIEVILNVEVEYQIMLAFVKETQKVNKEIILESKIIQGNIPSYYGNVNSLLK